MANVSGLRAQFENPKPSPTPQGSPGKPLQRPKTPTSSKTKRKDNDKDAVVPSKLSKSTLKNIGKSLSSGGNVTPTTTPKGSPAIEGKNKGKPAKNKSLEESSKPTHNDKAVAALAGVIKSSSNSPRGSKLSMNESSSPSSGAGPRGVVSGRPFSVSSSMDMSVNSVGEHQLEQSAEFIPTQQKSGRTDSEARRQKALSTPFPSSDLRKINTSPDSTTVTHAASPTTPTHHKSQATGKPTIGPKPTVLPKIKSGKPSPSTPKPPVPSRPKSLRSSVKSTTDENESKVNSPTDTNTLPSSAVHTESPPVPSQVDRQSDGSGSPIIVLSQTPTSPENITIKVFDEDILTNTEGSTSPSAGHDLIRENGVQSQADVTPIQEDVGGCKRSNADSGFQEDPEDMESKKGTPSLEWDEEKMEKNRKKRHKIAQELLDTEKSYVDHLKIIAVDFRNCISSLNVKSNKPIISDTTMNMIFLNIGEIYNLNTQLMTDLQKRMDEWESKEQITDVVNSFAPFLKLYSMYTARFEDSMKLLTETMSKEKKLDAAVKEFERKIGSGLGVAHYMLEPVQRIPRYKLLLTEYIKYLPQTSSERPSAEKALAVIAEAADKTNNRIKELENSNEILAIERSLSDYVPGSLLQAHRRFLKKGILQKLSRKKQTQRMFFLFTDILIHTEVTSLTTFKFKNEVPLCGMKLEVPKVSLVPHSFEVHGTNRSFILSASCEEEKEDWMSVLHVAINDDREKRKSIKRDQMLQTTIDRTEFGSTAPIMVPDQNVSQCQLCSKDFTFTFRRHHCRACGRVVCGHCSPFKTYLSYSKKEERICEVCEAQRRQSIDEDVVDGPVHSPLREQPASRTNIPSLLMVDPKEREEGAIMEGYVCELDGKKSARCWYMLGKDLALYKFRAHEDIRAFATLPLPGYNITPDENLLTITVSHPTSKKKALNLKFKVDSKDDFDSWYDVITKATQLLVADSVSRDPSPSYLSPVHQEPSPERISQQRSQSMSDILSNEEPDDLEISV